MGGAVDPLPSSLSLPALPKGEVHPWCCGARGPHGKGLLAQLRGAPGCFTQKQEGCQVTRCARSPAGLKNNAASS